MKALFTFDFMLGVTVGEAEIFPERMMAINPGRVHGPVPGLATKDPAFGLEAVWIEPLMRDQARALGYTVVDPATAIATHLNKVLRDNASELLSHDETQKLLDKLAAKSPKLVEDLVPGKLSLGALTRVLQQLLNESVSIRDIRTIAETLADATGRTIEQPRPVFPPPTGPVKLEAGTTVFILVRIADHAVERLDYFVQRLKLVPLHVSSFNLLWDSTPGACYLPPAARPNSVRIARNFTRSSSGCDRSCACASTRSRSVSSSMATTTESSAR